MVSFWKIKACSFNLSESFGTSESCQEQVPDIIGVDTLKGPDGDLCRKVVPERLQRVMGKGHARKHHTTGWEPSGIPLLPAPHSSVPSPTAQSHWQACGGLQGAPPGPGAPEGKGRRSILTWTQRDSHRDTKGFPRGHVLK